MSPRAVVAADVGFEATAEVSVAEHDNIIEVIPADGTKSLRIFSDLDIFLAAQGLINDRASEATKLTAELAEKLLRQGDIVGAGVMWAIIRAIGELQGDRWSAKR